MPSKNYNKKRKSNKRKRKRNVRDKYNRVTVKTLPRKTRFTRKEMDDLTEETWWKETSLLEKKNHLLRTKIINSGQWDVSAEEANKEKGFVAMVFTKKHHQKLNQKFNKNGKKQRKINKIMSQVEFGPNGYPYFSFHQKGDSDQEFMNEIEQEIKQNDFDNGMDLFQEYKQGINEKNMMDLELLEEQESNQNDVNMNVNENEMNQELLEQTNENDINMYLNQNEMNEELLNEQSEMEIDAESGNLDVFNQHETNLNEENNEKEEKEERFDWILMSNANGNISNSSTMKNVNEIIDFPSEIMEKEKETDSSTSSNADCPEIWGNGESTSNFNVSRVEPAPHIFRIPFMNNPPPPRPRPPPPRPTDD